MTADRKFGDGIFQNRRIPENWNLINPSGGTETALKRFSALVNIAQNGAETLDILLMPADTSVFTSYPHINSLVNRYGSKRVVFKAATRAQLRCCLEPIGAAARSDLDDVRWALTEFGIALKAPLIFTYQALFNISRSYQRVVNGRAVFGSISQGKSSPETTAFSRCQILFAGFDNQNQPVPLGELQRITRLGNSSLKEAIRSLKGHGLVEDEVLSPFRGVSITEYEVTEKGAQLPKWSKGYDKPSISSLVEFAIKQLSPSGNPITKDNVVNSVQNGASGIDIGKDSITGIFESMQKRKLIKATVNPGGNYSTVVCTELGLEVVKNVIDPLVRWAQDYSSVPRISEIARDIIRRPYIFNGLYREIAQDYIDTSPFRNNDSVSDSNRDPKIDRIILAISQNPGQLTRGDLALLMDTSQVVINQLIRSLVRSRYLTEIASNGNRPKYLYPSNPSTQ